MKIICALFVVLSAAAFAGANELIIDDFSQGKTVNSIGGNTGCWSINPNDTNQYCKSSFDTDNRLGEKGYALKLEYSVETPFTYVKEFPYTGMNGYFTEVLGKGVSNMKFLVLWLKGDNKTGFTRIISVDLKNPNQTGTFAVEGVTDEWQKFAVPLWQFGLNDLTNITEVTLNFNEKVTKKSGIIYVGGISFSNESGEVDAVATRVPAAMKINIDGDLTEWEKNGKLKMMVFDPAKNLEVGSIRDKQDLSAQTAFMWDDDYLYMAAWVRDDKIICGQTDADIYKDDCIELFIDPANQGFKWGGIDAFQLGFSPSGPDGKPHKWSWFNNENPGDNVLLASKIVKTRKWTGYLIEAAVKWKYLGITPKADLIIGASPAIHDIDSAGSNVSSKLNWAFSKDGDKIILGKMKLLK